jgi:hypothetical protein
VGAFLKRAPGGAIQGARELKRDQLVKKKPCAPAKAGAYLRSALF